MMFDESTLYYVKSDIEGIRRTLFDLASWKNGLAFKKIDFSEKGRPVIKIAELNNGISANTSFTEGDYGEEVYIRWDDLLFSWSGNPQTSIDVFRYRLQDGWLNQHIFKVTANEELIKKDFLYYVLKLLKPRFTQIATNKQTTGLGHVTIADLKRISLIIPSKDKQDLIVSILKALDDKIELNNRINDNLLEQLFSLYQNACTVVIKNVTLGSLCSFQEGYVNPAQTHPEYFDGDIKWLRAVDINESFIIETSRTLTYAGFQSAKKSAYLFPPNTIAISKSGTIGRLGIVADYMCGNRAVINIKPNDQALLPFIYAYLKSKQREFPELAVGSVQKNLYVSLLEPLFVSIPDTNTLTQFCNTGNALLNLMKNNCEENIRLASIRDVLLPRLMSGKLDVSEVEL